MHVSFILDGNGRWASDRGLPRALGHKKGAENVEVILRECLSLNINRVTLYAFSTENWHRPVYEVKALMNLFKYYLNKKLTQLHQENVKVSIIGDVRPFPIIIRKYIRNLVDLTQNNDGMHLNLALNYGGRAEILRATNNIVRQALNKKIKIEEIDEELFKKHLYTHGQSDPDLIIRTAGEKRLSNFLLWQSAYSELYFVEKSWPDFTRNDLIEALNHYNDRKRTYGTLESIKEPASIQVI